jgi:hypothetical protein
MTPLQIAKQLRRLSKAMVTLGVAMDYHCGFSEIGRHGRDLVNAGLIAKGWATGIEDEHRASKVSDGGTATPNVKLRGGALLRRPA